MEGLLHKHKSGTPLKSRSQLVNTSQTSLETCKHVSFGNNSKILEGRIESHTSGKSRDGCPDPERCSRDYPDTRLAMYVYKTFTFTMITWCAFPSANHQTSHNKKKRMQLFLRFLNAGSSLSPAISEQFIDNKLQNARPFFSSVHLCLVINILFRKFRSQMTHWSGPVGLTIYVYGNGSRLPASASAHSFASTVLHHHNSI